MAFSVFVLLILAAKNNAEWFFLRSIIKDSKFILNKKSDDRTGLVTVHPELLNKDGFITDEDLLTVRFSKDTDHPQSSEKPSE